MRSGLAAMIEIARLFAAGPRPERTLVFAAWTAEERGLLGSEYYAQHPLYPHETMVANLTLDTLQMGGPVKDVVLIGQGQSEMEELLAEAAQAQGRYVTPEGHPERGLFYRADHFSLAKRGVPVLLNMALAGAYDLANGGRAAGERWLNDFTGNCYHQTCDAWSPSWDLRGAVQEARTLLCHRRAAREQPRLAAMVGVLGIREGARTERRRAPLVSPGVAAVKRVDDLGALAPRAARQALARELQAFPQRGFLRRAIGAPSARRVVGQAA